jgi:hypothetical protein
LFPQPEEATQRSIAIKEKQSRGETATRRSILSPDHLIESPIGMFAVIFQKRSFVTWIDALQSEKEFESPYEALQCAFEQFADERCMGTRPLLKTFEEEKNVGKEKKKWTYYKKGSYKWITYKQCQDRVNNISKGLYSLGFDEGSFAIDPLIFRPENKANRFLL